MTGTEQFTEEGIERQPMRVFAEKAYLDYSMYVILDRALPHIGDGLKPVQRRIIYAMSELGLAATSKHKKSARTVGDVLGKFHPHGDSACYESMVLMAQPFSYRYPLIDGQGNWGSADDPKSFAAMRYTEARLARFSEVLLSELGQGTADWVPNFDGTLEEPATLPARLPHVLLNGTTGIAVGMATDIPPHNVREVASACIHLLEDPKATVKDLFKHIKGPDYPTAAEIITPKADILKIYQTGNGGLRMRAVYEMEDGEIIVTALPHQVSGGKVLEQIAGQMNAKKLPMVEDLRDESDHENPTRLVIVPRSNRVDIEALMLHLFSTTDLERTYRVNLNVIGLDGRPRVKDLRTLLEEWLQYRTETVRRRLQFRLDKVEDRFHVVQGLLIAYLNIDEVIAIIRNEDKPKAALIQRFQLTERQADSILDLRLRQLAKLEEIKLKGELDELAEERDTLQKILGSKARLKTLVRKELEADAESYGDARRSPLVARDVAQALDVTELIPTEPVTVVLSQKGWVRLAKGHEVDPTTLNYKEGDGFLAALPGKSNQTAVFVDSAGRSYSLAAHTLPSARGYGEPLTGRLKTASGTTFVGTAFGDTDSFWLMASDAGYGFITKLEDLITKNKAGKSAISPPKGAFALGPQPLTDIENDCVAAVTTNGYLLLVDVCEIPELARGKGIKIINIPSAKLKAREEYLIGVAVVPEGASLTIFSGQRHLTLKPADLEHYYGERAKRGLVLPRGFRRVDRIQTVLK